MNSARFEPAIGLEVHARLRTRTKMFCGCANDFGGAPNSRVCPVCLGLPGSLPTVGAAAVSLGMRIALALGCAVQPVSRFDRKTYFYPDLPKNYQITQYAEPLALGGSLDVPGSEGGRPVRIERLHLEEDAARLVHRPGAVLVDANRAGVPLAEIVTRPDLRSGEEARDWLAALRRLLIHLDACDGNLERGSLRCDANISLRPAGAREPGAPVEIKNLNTLQGVRRALEFERRRQRSILEDGGTVARETRGWDADRGETFPMRPKETTPDYRYFPEPDLPALRLDEREIRAAAASLPEPPAAIEARFVRDHGLPPADAWLLTETPATAAYFEAVAAAAGDPVAAARWVVGEVRGVLNSRGWRMEDFPVAAAELAALLRLLREGAIARPAARAAFDHMVATGAGAEEAVERLGLRRIADSAELARLAAEILAEHPAQARQWREGKDALADFFLGLIIRRTGGRADPAAVRETLEAVRDRRP